MIIGKVLLMRRARLIGRDAGRVIITVAKRCWDVDEALAFVVSSRRRGDVAAFWIVKVGAPAHAKGRR